MIGIMIDNKLDSLIYIFIEHHAHYTSIDTKENCQSVIHVLLSLAGIPGGPNLGFFFLVPSPICDFLCSDKSFWYRS